MIVDASSSYLPFSNEQMAQMLDALTNRVHFHEMDTLRLKKRLDGTEAEMSQIAVVVRHVEAEACTSTLEVNQAKADIVGLSNSRDLLMGSTMGMHARLDKMGNPGSGGGSGSIRTIMFPTR